MALTDADKRFLAQQVKYCIAIGYSKTKTVEKLKGMGFNQHTIRAYYDTFSKG